MAPESAFASTAYQIRFACLLRNGRGMVFPCDSSGSVSIDDLSERGRISYFFARAMVGREFALPVVRAA